MIVFRKLFNTALKFHRLFLSFNQRFNMKLFGTDIDNCVTNLKTYSFDVT